jgi:hypothetical protein
MASAVVFTPALTAKPPARRASLNSSASHALGLGAPDSLVDSGLRLVHGAHHQIAPRLPAREIDGLLLFVQQLPQEQRQRRQKHHKGEQQRLY